MALAKDKLNEVTNKATPVLADSVLISDSEDGGRGKLVTGTALRSLIGGGATIDPSGTDDTIALQAAIDAGGVVQLGEGTYIITSVDISNDVIIQGVGNDTIIKRKDGTLTTTQADDANKMFSIDTASAKIVIRDLVMDGNESNQNAAEVYGQTILLPTSIEITDKDNPVCLSVQNVTFRNEACGNILIQPATISTARAHVLIDNCNFEAIRRGSATSASFLTYYITICDNTWSVIRNNRFVFSASNPNDGLSSPTAIRGTFYNDANSSNATGTEMLIEGNYIYRCGRGNDGHAIEVTESAAMGAIDFYGRAKNIRVVNNHIKDSYSVAIRGKSSTESIIVSHNIIDGVFHREGIVIGPNNYLEQAGKAIISNNIIKNVYYSGISVVGNSGTVEGTTNSQLYYDSILIDCNLVDGVTSQTIDATTKGHGIRLATFKEATVSGNILKAIDEKGIEVSASIDDDGSQLIVSKNQIYSGLRGIETLAGFFGRSNIYGNIISVSGSDYGMFIYGFSGKSSTAIVKGNQIIKSNNTAIYGKYLDAVLVDGNIALNVASPSYFCRFDAGTSNVIIRNNYSAVGVYPFNDAGFVIDGNSWNPKIRYGTAAPSSGTYTVGDIVYNTAPAPSGYTGWICTVAGTPGTWKGFGVIEA